MAKVKAKELSKWQIFWAELYEKWENLPTPVQIMFYGLASVLLTTALQTIGGVDVENLYIRDVKIDPTVASAVMLYASNIITNILKEIAEKKGNLEGLSEMNTQRKMDR